MQTTAVRLYTWGYAETKTYLAALLFVLGNIVLPQLFHLVPQGGMTWLPIYFFTLVGAYKYGWRVGLLTAIFSPLVNSVLFGMPPVGALPAILLKSVLMAVIGGYVAGVRQRSRSFGFRCHNSERKQKRTDNNCHKDDHQKYKDGTHCGRIWQKH